MVHSLMISLLNLHTFHRKMLSGSGMFLNISQFFTEQIQDSGAKKFEKTIYVEDKNLIKNQRIISVGRAADNDIVLGDIQISSHHAKFFLEGKNIILEDLNRLTVVL